MNNIARYLVETHGPAALERWRGSRVLVTVALDSLLARLNAQYPGELDTVPSASMTVVGESATQHTHVKLCFDYLAILHEEEGALSAATATGYLLVREDR